MTIIDCNAELRQQNCGSHLIKEMTTITYVPWHRATAMHMRSLRLDLCFMFEHGLIRSPGFKCLQLVRCITKQLVVQTLTVAGVQAKKDYRPEKMRLRQGMED